MGIQNKVAHEKVSPLGCQVNYLSVNWFNKDLEVSGETNQGLKIDRLFWSSCFLFTVPHNKKNKIRKNNVPMQGKSNKLKPIREKKI